MTIEIIPSLLVGSKSEFERRLRLVENDCEVVHVDILDGTLFPNTTWFDAASVGAMRTNVKYELHLMVENPLPIVEAWREHVETMHRAIVHSEIHRPLGAVIEHIKDMMKLEAGVALNPETPLGEMHEVLHKLDQVTIMGVHPGQSGQAFLGDFVLDKIREVRNHRPDIAIEIDGGVTDDLLEPCIRAGATRICAASLLFSCENPAAKLKDLRSRATLLSTKLS